MEHLDSLSDGVEPRFFPITSDTRAASRVTTIIYNDLPEPGQLIGLTYGLSLSDHPEWRLSKPELCINVNSTDHRWAHAIGELAHQLRGDCPFCYGDTINFGEPISPESDMTAFVIFAPSILSRTDYSNIDVGDELPINIAGCYPIYDSERHYIHQNGLEAFWRHDWDPRNVTRAPVG